MEFRDKRVIVLGLGKSGRAAVRFLVERGAEVSSYDDHLSGMREADVLCERYDFAVVSPGVPTIHRAVRLLKERGVPILSEIDLAYINCPSRRIFAVSGTNGKTTTCHILHEMLSAVGNCHLVGNVGVPFTEKLEVIRPKDLVVVEISSFQIEQSSFFRPNVVAFTNVGEDHLDRHGSAENYRRIKLSLCDRARMCVANADDPFQDGIHSAVRYSMSKENADCFLTGRRIVFRGKGFTLPDRSRGGAYDADYLCAFTAASACFGVKKAFLSAYEKTVVPRYRNERIGKIRGAVVINDSKGTNTDATLFALREVEGRVAIILGGSDKGEDYSRLMTGVGERVERIYLTGANAGDMYLSAMSSVRLKCRLMSDLEGCVRDFISDPLDCLLFSPASASFDSYADYEERGRCFDEIVEKYRDR